MEKKTGEQSVADEKKVGTNKGLLKSEKAPDVAKAAPESEVDLTFRENRSYELHLGPRKVIRFMPRQKKRVDAKILDHKEFTDNVKKLFIIEPVGRSNK